MKKEWMQVKDSWVMKEDIKLGVFLVLAVMFFFFLFFRDG